MDFVYCKTLLELFSYELKRLNFSRGNQEGKIIWKKLQLIRVVNQAREKGFYLVLSDRGNSS